MYDVITAALAAAFANYSINEVPILTPPNQAGIGDFQCNAIVRHAGRHKLDGKSVAKVVVDAIELPSTVATFSVTGPGFINIKLGAEYLCHLANQMASSEKLGIQSAKDLGKVVLDFGGPNVAKALHVGHLRSFVIGESLRRILIETGRTVISDIHLGDHGLQMGKLLLGLESVEGAISTINSATWSIETLEAFYLQGAALSKVDKKLPLEQQQAALACLQRARDLTSQLQDRDPHLLAVWQLMRTVSLDVISQVIDVLDCHFDLMLGESDSHATVLEILEYLKETGGAALDAGAIVVPLGDGKPPLILQSGDDTVLYGATDLATLVERVSDFGAQEIIYCVDDRQSHHLLSVFAAAEKTGLGKGAICHHAKFGTVKGKDGKPLKTREGVPHKLSDLIETVAAAAKAQMKADVSQEDVELVALSALKFADLSTDRLTGYVFDEEKMTAMEGKSGPYLLYACVRIKSMLAKADAMAATIAGLDHVDEVALMLELSKWPEAVSKAAKELKPHHVADVAYAIAQSFSRFYANVPVVTETDPGLRGSRLALCGLTLKVMTRALHLLGIAVPERM